MKKISILVLTLSLTLFACSSSDDDNPVVNNPVTTGYAMTAKINGVIFQANNPYGNNQFSSTNIYSYFPEEDFVMLQGRKGGIWGNPEINIWLKKSDIALGTYPIGQETFDTPPSHFIDLIDNSNDISENTNEGSITITEVNSTTKIVKGTFRFTTTEELGSPTPNIDITVTEGTFRYTYE
jgi:uncharacterized protein DUF6252